VIGGPIGTVGYAELTGINRKAKEVDDSSEHKLAVGGGHLSETDNQIVNTPPPVHKEMKRKDLLEFEKFMNGL